MTAFVEGVRVFSLPSQGSNSAGDVVEALDWFSVAAGHGAVAADRAHDHLRELNGAVLSSAAE